MKTIQILSISLCLLIGLNLQAQIENPFGKSKQIQNEIRNLRKQEKQKKKKQESQVKEEKDSKTTEQQIESKEDSPQLVWAKYDFVPGDVVIFEDDLLGEENGEFPSRWDLVNGNVEVAEFGGENVIMFRGGDPTIIPYLKNSKEDYLPDVFTIEFDLNLPCNSMTVYFYDKKNQRSPSSHTYLNISNAQMHLSPASSKLPGATPEFHRWMHVAIAFTNGKMKVYMDDTRLINIPRLAFNPSGLSIEAYHANDKNTFYIKNIRIAEGGVKYYDRIMQDGKIVATGIRFDVGKATLKPESMGIINEMVKMMQKHPELIFSIEGHTDSDGDDAGNLKLSEERAKTVMNTMVKLGISTERLSTKGFGESVPANTNDTPEGKANNRRVEFVKI